jgi:hypothetical protein
MFLPAPIFQMFTYLSLSVIQENGDLLVFLPYSVVFNRHQRDGDDYEEGSDG